MARRADRLEALSEKILKTYAGTKIEVIAADLAKESDLVRVEKVLATNPAVHVLVNNAGLARLAPIAQAHAKLTFPDGAGRSVGQKN